MRLNVQPGFRLGVAADGPFQGFYWGRLLVELGGFGVRQAVGPGVAASGLETLPLLSKCFLAAHILQAVSVLVDAEVLLVVHLLGHFELLLLKEFPNVAVQTGVDGGHPELGDTVVKVGLAQGAPLKSLH